MNQENIINPNLLELFENYFNKRLSQFEAEEFNNRLASDPEFKAVFESFLLSRAAINEKIEISLKHDLKKWKSEVNNKPETRIFTLSRIRVAIAASVIGLISLTAYQNYSLNKFINEKIEDNLSMDMASRSGDQNRVDKIISEYKNDKTKLLTELEKFSVLDPEYGYAQKYLGYKAVHDGNCNNTQKYLNNAMLNKQDVSLAVILCHIKCKQYDAEFEKELNSILADPEHNYYKVALDIKNKMSSIWWKLLK